MKNPLRLYAGLSSVAVLMTLICLWVDVLWWYQLTHNQPNMASEILRFGRTAIIFLFVLLMYKNQVATGLQRWLVVAFVFVVIADWFIIIEGNLIFGILFFMVMQILLIVRHAPAISFFITQVRDYILPLGLSILLYGGIYFWLQPLLKGHPFKEAIYIYAALLILSCFMAYVSRYKAECSGKVSVFIFWAMVLFLLCDITVLLPLIFPESSVVHFIRTTTGLFYTPSLLLLAWSGYQKQEVTTC